MEMGILIGIFVGIIVIYAIVVGQSDNNILTSTILNDGNKKIKADLIYYLPVGSLTVNATAKVIIVKNTDPTTLQTKITSAKVGELSVSTLVSIVPDTKFSFKLEYSANYFSNDEFKISTGPTGLLDSISTTTEDRLGNIIGLTADVPSKILSIQQTALGLIPPPTGNQASETRTFNKSFFLSARDIRKGKAVCSWFINADGQINKTTEADASFIIEFSPERNERVSANSISPSAGIFTRPLKTIIMTVRPKSRSTNRQGIVKTEIQIPDVTRLINIPVKRSPFVKRVNTPKFSNGMITGNFMNKPSEVEGFLSIPINIGKALVSIPGQLFSFKIQHQHQNEIASLLLQKKLMDLKKQTKTTSLNK
ncbi:hypothetical protein ACFFGT_04135 [Mucilaginibacter angelicae]|uniref:Uncharacterized protein n=1 Tax=Mucilaginibacter angelicae TaxID=869718 RepID=A0ABV6L137_9SPHI